jgi:hypothetical protein
MENFTLYMITLTVGITATPGLTEAECQRQAELIVADRSQKAFAWCEPTRPVICPFGPPCWRNGQRCLDGALCRRLEDN